MRSKDTETEKRLYVIRRMLARLEWDQDVASKLATEWGVTLNRVQQLAAEANRSLRLPPEERDACQAEMAARCDEVYRDAMASRNEMTGLHDHKGALDAILLGAKFRGAAPIDGGGPLVTVNTAPVVVQVTPEAALACAPGAIRASSGTADGRR